MKKIALVFVLAVFVPSLVLAWLAVRSLRDQQFALERQQTLLCQGVADGLATAVAGAVRTQQREFAQQVESLLAGRAPRVVAWGFDQQLRQQWPLAEVGFAVTMDGSLLAPSMFDCTAARQFRLDNERFLTSRETVEVIWNSPKGAINLSQLDRDKLAGRDALALKETGILPHAESLEEGKSVFATKAGKIAAGAGSAAPPLAPESPNASVNETAFRQLIGDSMEGTVARFLQDQLKLILWYRPPRDPLLVFGTQLDLARVIDGLRPLITVEPNLRAEVAVALLDDDRQVVAAAPADFQGDWKRPFVASAIGEVLPHWEVAVLPQNPARLHQAAQAARLTLGLLIGVLVLAIAVGGWLIVGDLRRQLRLARQKTDFVSNVSHELKTPLTSIRMFAELLAEGRVSAPARQRFFLNAIKYDAGRLTRLINNVLDFSRMERHEKQYHFEPCDLSQVVRDAVAGYRPHLEAHGFQVAGAVPDGPTLVRADPDALAQVLVNLISNAEKYSTDPKEITVELAASAAEESSVEVRVLDRGLGVPPGAEEKIFEQFYRAHDALSSGIQGAGLGLTLARQIARAHGGDLRYRPRAGRGSCFVLCLPVTPQRPASVVPGTEPEPAAALR